MSLLFRVVSAWKCQGTHHKLAVDALPLLRGDDADGWRNLFLTRFDDYLRGAKAPDDAFKDFRNHVLHVADGGWGGAVAAAEQWYQQTVDALRERRWSQAVYAAGVLSHYVTDPVMPLHTGQSVAENNMHRACEWSVSQAYDRLRQRLEAELGGLPRIELPAQEQWLKRLLTRNAAAAHAEYDRIVREYDFGQGVKSPLRGLNDDLQLIFARLLGLAIGSYARVLERALEESQVRPPWTLPTLTGVLAAIRVPIDWVVNRLNDAEERRYIRAIYRELQQTGRVEQTLPEENRTIRELHAREVLGKPAIATAAVTSAAAPSAAAAATAPQTATPGRDLLPVSAAPPAQLRKAKLKSPLPRFYLELDDPIVDAPSIGPKTAKKLQQVGISCVEVFLEHTPADVAALLDSTPLTLEEVRAWQQQARLMCQVPGLRGHDVQMLVACGVAAPEELAAADIARLHQQLTRFVATPTARRLIRNPQPPDKAEIANWVAWASHSRPLRAA